MGAVIWASLRREGKARGAEESETERRAKKLFRKDESRASRPEFLALKHGSRILGHSCNPVCGFSMMEQVRLCAVWLMENWLGSSLNQIQDWTSVRKSYSRALEQGSLLATTEERAMVYCSICELRRSRDGAPRSLDRNQAASIYDVYNILGFYDPPLLSFGLQNQIVCLQNQIEIDTVYPYVVLLSIIYIQNTHTHCMSTHEGYFWTSYMEATYKTERPHFRTLALSSSCTDERT